MAGLLWSSAIPPEYSYSIVPGLIEGPASVSNWVVQRRPFQRAYQ